MRHQQILDKLAAPVLVRALNEDLARWVGWQLVAVPEDHRDLGQRVIPPILTRWRCLLDAADTAAETRHRGWVAMAVLLHRYGLADEAVTAHASAAIDSLNRDVVLSDAFARQSPAVKDFLATPPPPLTRRPRRPGTLTLLRPGDVVSIQVEASFYAAFVRQVAGGNEYPVIEFYSGRFQQPPTLNELSGRAAARDRGGARFGVVGLTYLPDPANQVRALASQHPQPPLGNEPGPGEGRYTMTDIIRLQRAIVSLLSERT
ncbi:hypothetical protein [Verrucosispora sioxanthis]|uniref:Uncharacterized protein n=1 Tax=Verrucosispora sioxanthis TaxID=2499994 RepID=A0A6M1L2P8_9ACTN|nr:hypothetical protein [Verrucosispora sioxanthis]NEE63607.1 hypothetical protein [Verrucosispora sioxanthis]NGM12717.1 hypothetical protein [Verrucosispora sioxanthis]